MGALHEKHVYVRGRLPEQLLEDSCLAAVTADVARVEETPTVGSDEERVGVERRMVVEVWRDLERADLQVFPVPQEARGLD